MPEWPEVATVIESILPDVRERQILRADASPHLGIDAEQLRGWSIYTIRQRGKHILVHLLRTKWLRHCIEKYSPYTDEAAEYLARRKQRRVLAIHLMMSGVLTTAAPERLADHVHLRLRLGPSLRYREGSNMLLVAPHRVAFVKDTDPRTQPQWLYFVDPRRFGKVRICCYPSELRSVLRNTGPDISTLNKHAMGDVRFLRRLRTVLKQDTAVYSALMDQRAISGFGNIYAQEACFAAGLLPTRTLRDCADVWLQRLLFFESVRLLHRAKNRQGASVSSYRTPDGVRGGAQDLLFVYGRGGQPCSVCNTPIEKMRIKGRTVCWCPTCQK